MQKPLAVLALLTIAFASACSESGDYLAVAGGGFVFNYRIAEATYGIALTPLRDIPDDAVIEATFDNPSGGEPIVLTEQGPFNPTRISFQTSPLQGIVADHPYKVVVLLTDAAGAELQRLEKTFQSELDQSVLPDDPLAIGPGCQENVDGSETAYPDSVNAPAPAP
jgi:hypothetical protein